ncbi:MAG: hypothetical protein ABI068_01705, partial [Ktedonobacterales bacterium]
ARELTKLHEEWLRGPLSELHARCAATAPRGEYTLVVAGAQPVEGESSEASDASREQRALAHLRELLAQGVRTRDAAALVAESAGLPRRAAYQLALRVVAESASDDKE